MTEKHSSKHQESLVLEPQQARQIGAAAIGFFEGDRHMVSRPITSGDYRSLISRREADGTHATETIATGDSTIDVLENTLDAMRTLESTITKPEFSLTIKEGQMAHFTSLAEYAPKIAPTTEAYPVPDYLNDVMQDDKASMYTYQETTGVEGWQQQTYELVEDYLTTVAGSELADSLKIKDVRALTPEQAIKLSVAFVQGVSKYSYDSVQQANTPYDSSTTMALLKDGIANKSNPAWKGNGVCRNVAANVKAVFEAIKASQQDMSMLRNTYAVYKGGDSRYYQTERQDINQINQDGHAWNVFVTVDGTGSSAVTVTDATWALERDAPSALQHMDYTMERSADMTLSLLRHCEDKQMGLAEASRYYTKLVMQSRDKQKAQEFVTGEYLRAADLVLDADGKIEVGMPPFIPRAAYQLSASLDKREIETLHALSQYDERMSSGRFKMILTSYVRGDGPQGSRKSRRMLFADDELQQLAIDVASEEMVKDIAEQSGEFRARMREVRPDLLPPFDPSRAEDARELLELARFNHLNSIDPARIVKEAHRRLQTGTDPQKYQEAVTGLSDYEIVKNFQKLKRTLQS